MSRLVFSAVIRRLAHFLLGFSRNPSQLVLAAFASLIGVGTLLLRLPFAADASVAHPGWLNSMFWSTSATTVTGLGTSDFSDWSLFGELVLLGLIQVGGFGIMTIGATLALVASSRLGLRHRMIAQAEIGQVSMGELKHLLGAIAKITFTIEGVLAVILAIRFATYREIGIGRAMYAGVYHAVSAFNNAGISLQSDSLVQFAGDPFITLPISFAFIIGGLGFPVWVELRRRGRNYHRWSLHTRVTLFATTGLLIIGPLAVLCFEWSNAGTLGPMNIFEKLEAAWFQGVTTRTAGFNTVDLGALHEPTANIMSALMFIGAGPASTSGGIKITTFAILGFAVWAEVRGDTDINVFHRRLDHSLIRQALTVALLSTGLVFATAVSITTLTPFHLTDSLFEATSAFGTVGLSRGITPYVGGAEQLILIAVMLAGRVGPVTFVTALALKNKPRAYRYVEERPIIG